MTRFLPFLLAVAMTGTAHAQGAAIEALESLPDAPLAEAFRNTLPPAIDLSARLPPPRDQSWTATCTSWAVTYAAGSEALRRSGDPNLRLSPAFTYKLAGGGQFCETATAISATLNVLKTHGALPVEDYTFDAGWCGREATPDEKRRAEQFRIKGWSKLPAADLNAVKGQLARGRPVMFSMSYGPQFRTYKGPGTFEIDEAGAARLSHAMVLVGYDDGRKAFRLLNSWGRGWGDGGYGWIGYDLWRKVQGVTSVAFVID